MNNYTVMNLSMISRLAILENAERTGKSIDYLVEILRYTSMTEKTISTVGTELEIIRKMFYLHEMKKGLAFLGVIVDELKEDKCYIDKGELVAYVHQAISKKTCDNKECLEVIVSVKQNEGHVVIKIKDNGDPYENELREDVSEAYKAIAQRYNETKQSVITMKPGIGTIVELIR